MTNETKRKTVGRASVELKKKEPEKATAIDLQRSMQSEFIKNFEMAQEDGKKAFSPQDFYIIVLTQRERLMDNVFRNKFFPRLSCPTPQYDQVVYKYYSKDDRVEMLWVLPDKETYHMLIKNALLVPPEQKELLKYVLDDSSGELLIKCKKLNGEI